MRNIYNVEVPVSVTGKNENGFCQKGPSVCLCLFVLDELSVPPAVLGRFVVHVLGEGQRRLVLGLGHDLSLLSPLLCPTGTAPVVKHA